MATSQSATNKKATLQKQMEELKKQMELLDQEAIHELKLKLGDARKVVRDLEAELAKLTGEPLAAASAKPKTRRTRRPSISDEALKEQLIKMMAAFGQEGMNARQIADRMNLDAIRVRKFIAANKQVLKRQGKGPGTKFYLP